MRSYYNDSDPFCADWLRNLIDAGEIPPGDVDERSITDVTAADLDGYAQCHLFAGIAGWPLALRLAGVPPTTPVWTGSCPCQPFSSAGKGLGEKDPRHLWPDFFRLIRECRPPTVLGEQVSAAIKHGWLDRVFADLEGEAYACGAAVLPACSVSAPHIRQRLFWVADAVDTDWRRQSESRPETYAPSGRCDSSNRLADTERNGGRINEQERGPEGRTADRGTGAGTDRLGIANGTGSFAWRESASSNRHRHSAIATGSRTDRLGDANGSQSPLGEVQSARQERQAATGAGGHDYAIVYCRDGKSRRIPDAQSGILPLAHGIPRDLGRRFPQLARMVASARANRVGRLRAYGNAIVPGVAAAFIRAYLEARSQS